MATKLQDGNTPCLAATPSDPRPTVLVFDSGVGGLSVYDEIRHLLPDLHYIYAFDNVAFPYGEKSEDFIVERVVEIVTAVQARYPLALAVIACNTASTVSLPSLREKFPFPVVGVVPAIKPAARLTANGIVGLLATRGTVKRPYTRELIDRFANECQIAMLGSAELVEMAEAKYAELKLQYDAGFSSFLNSFLKIDEETLSRFVSDKLCAYIDALGTTHQLPEAVDRALERTTEQLVADVIEQADFSDAAEMALTKAVEEQLDYLHISFRR